MLRVTSTLMLSLFVASSAACIDEAPELDPDGWEELDLVRAGPSDGLDECVESCAADQVACELEDALACVYQEPSCGADCDGFFDFCVFICEDHFGDPGTNGAGNGTGSGTTNGAGSGTGKPAPDEAAQGSGLQ